VLTINQLDHLVSEYLELAKKKLGPHAEITQLQTLILALIYCYTEQSILTRTSREC